MIQKGTDPNCIILPHHTSIPRYKEGVSFLLSNKQSTSESSYRERIIKNPSASGSLTIEPIDVVVSRHKDDDIDVIVCLET